VSRTIPALCLLLALTPALKAQDDVADVASQDLKAGKDEKKRYFLIAPAKDAKPPKDGFGLVIVMPGGDGSADFHPFVKRIYKNAIPDGYAVAQPVAVKWNNDQEIVWPTAGNNKAVKNAKFTTEEFVGAVIDDVATKYKVDPQRIFTLTWSSSGPAAYAVSLTSKKVTGSLVAMSVFRPDWLPDLKSANGHAYFLYHSPDDRVCPYRMAQQAEMDLTKAGAKVKLVDYEGGHGWRGPLYDDIRAGIEWLEKNHADPTKH
jgi:predicted esterase